MAVRPRPVVLCVLDGWGFREDAADNATTRAILRQSPASPDALYYVGEAERQANHKTAAQTLWQNLQKLLPPDSKEYAFIDKKLKELR